MLNGLFTDVLQSPGSCTLYIRLLCVLCVRMYVHMCVCSFVAVAHCLRCSTYTPTQHPPTRAHRNSQSLPVLMWRRSHLSQKRRLRGEWLHCTELRTSSVCNHTCTHMRTHAHTHTTDYAVLS